MKPLENGRYLMGIDIGNRDTTSMLLVPMGPRNIPRWEKAVSISEEEFRDWMQDRARARLEREQRK